MIAITTHSDGETINAGIDFARQLQPGNVVACFGDLGTGKTRFIKGICKGLGVNEHVASPTFTIINEYNIAGLHICHFDFYRLKSLNELREIGFEEYVNSDALCLIEWADRVHELLPPNRYDVHLTLGNDEQTRHITIKEVVGIVA